MRFPLIAGGLLVVSIMAFTAEAPRSDSVPRRARRAPVLSPQVDEERRVTFRLRAPRAGEVLVNGQWGQGNTSLAKSEESGVWTATVGPVDPGVYEYSFLVDGLRMIDPGNPAIKPMRQPRTSILHVPGTPPLVHDFRDVPHGTVRFHSYRSEILERLRHLAVYTPPGYEHRKTAEYPVLLLQHGMGDNHATWIAHGKAHWILDNLIASRKARPMIVIMMDGHAVTRGGPGAGFGSNTEAFEREFLQEVLPWVEAHYRVKPGAENRGIVGLSMGGGQSLTIGLNHADQFAWVGGFSSATPSEEAVSSALADKSTTNANLKLLWIACGRSDFLLDRNERFVALLKEKGLDHEWHLTAGDHSWPIWRGYLAEFAPRLFQD
jgi:enterochelin esterase family protein